jgi:hypothetical protein
LLKKIRVLIYKNKKMKGLSNLIMELSATGMFSSLESLKYNAISKDHIGDILATFNNQKIEVQVFTGDDHFMVAERIVKKAKF